MARAALRPVNYDDRLSLVEHLDELRTRLIVCALVFAVAFGLCLWQNHLLLDIANNPLPNSVDEPITLSPTEAFTTTMTVSAYFAILLALPIILYQLYAFVLPAFTPSEKRVAKPLLLLIPVLFIMGVVFCYFVVLRGGRVAATFTRDEITPEAVMTAAAASAVQ